MGLSVIQLFFKLGEVGISEVLLCISISFSLDQTFFLELFASLIIDATRTITVYYEYKPSPECTSIQKQIPVHHDIHRL